MKFTCQVDIDLPLDQTVALWNNPENLHHWQDDFISFEHVSGEPATVGAISKLTYSRFDLMEKILTIDLPHTFIAEYSMGHMVNTMANKFSRIGMNKTRWEVEIEYTEFKGFMAKMMSWLMPGMFKRQTQQWLDQFKVFAESSDS